MTSELTNGGAHAPSARQLTKLALPIAAGMLSLSLLSLVETIILGHYNQVALAASGAANYVFFIFLSAFAGFAISAQTQVARYIDSDPQKARRFVHICIFQITSCALLILGAVSLFKTEIIAFQVNDPVLIEAGSIYLQIKTFSVLPIALLMSMRGYWHGANKPKVFLLCLLASHIGSGVLCYLLVNGELGLPELGLNGAAVGNLISITVGTLILLLLSRHLFVKQEIQRISLNELKTGWQLAWPTSLQQTIFAIGTAAFMAIIGRLGVSELAAAHLLITLSLILILPIVGIGMAATTFISQSYSQFQATGQHPELSTDWYRIAIQIAGGLVAMISLGLYAFPNEILQTLTDEPDVIDAAFIPLLVLAPSLLLEAFAITTKQSLYAIRQNKAVMKVLVFTQWGVLLPSMLVLHLTESGSLELYLLMHAGQRAVNSIWLYSIWRREHKRNHHSVSLDHLDMHKIN